MSARKSRVFIVTYRLPVTLTRLAPGQWGAVWVADDITARSAGSIANDNDTMWVGVVNRECFDAVTLAALVAAPPPPPADVVPASPPPPLPTGLDGTVAGGVGALAWPLICPDIAAIYGGSVGGKEPTVCGGAAASAEAVAAAAAAAAALGSEAPPASPPLAPVPRIALCPPLYPEDIAGITAALNALSVMPVFLPPLLHEGFASYTLSVLKPALHNVLETGTQRIQPRAASLDFLAAGWRHYSAANEAISTVLRSQFGVGDLVWWHDFWLMRGPHCLVHGGGGGGGSLCGSGDLMHRPAQVFYMHAPFPTSEIFRTIPVREELLRSLLECDVIGFHTFNYARHFLQSAKRLLGHPFRSRPGGALSLDVDGRDVLVAISHVGVERGALDTWMSSHEAASVARHFASLYEGRIVLAGIDSCQRLSGCALKLLALERLLEENVVYQQRIVLVQRCETARQALSADVARTSAELRERVALINATYGRVVVDYAEAPSFSPEFRMGLFHRADVLLQTPICEGLNLLPLEYIYARMQWQLQSNSSAAARSAALPRTLSSPPVAAGVAVGAVGAVERLSLLRSPLTSSSSSSSSSNAGGSGLSISGRLLLATGGAGGSSSAASGSGISRTPSMSVVAAPAPVAVEGDTAAAAAAAAAALPLSPPPHGGCVILSEFSTASHALNSNLTVNPWSIGAVSREIDKALSVSDTDRSQRQWRDYQFAISNPSAHWSRALLRDVSELRAEREAEVSWGAGVGSGGRRGSTLISPNTAALAVGAAAAAAAASVLSPPRPHGPPLLDHAEVCRAFAAAKHRVIIFDYGGTLMERSAMLGRTEGHGNRHDFHTDGYPSALPPGVLGALGRISASEVAVGSSSVPAVTRLYVVSGLRAAAVEALQVSKLRRVGICAENGMFVSHAYDFEAEGHGIGGWSAGGSTAFSVAAGLGTPASSVGSPAGSFLAPIPDGSVSVSMSPGAMGVASREPLLAVAAGHHAPPALGTSGGSGTTMSPPTRERSSRALSLRGLSTPPVAPRAAETLGAVGAATAAATSGVAAAAVSEEHMYTTAARKWSTAPVVETSDALSTAAVGSGGGGYYPSGAPPAEYLEEWESVKRASMVLMADYECAVNGAVVREYDALVAWDFKSADGEWSHSQACFLAADLEALLAAGGAGFTPAFAARDICVTVRKTRVEVALRCMNKGRLVSDILSRASSAAATAAAAVPPPPSTPLPLPHPIDFVLCIGDDATDEAMFKTLASWSAAAAEGAADAARAAATAAAAAGVQGSAPPPPTVFTCTVGRKPATAAGAFLPDVESVHALVKGLAGVSA